MTSGELDRFRKYDPLPPDASNPEDLEWIKRGQHILGGLTVGHSVAFWGISRGYMSKR